MDHYEVIRQVGQGAFGSALLVKHRHGDDELLYVIKEIHLRQVKLKSDPILQSKPLLTA